ncbi:MAG: hypothetical protein IJR40_04805 [Treponema sp.]|nr:hypothetical protein [Treponema sp.]
MKKTFVLLVCLALSFFAAPASFALPTFLAQTLSVFYISPGTPVIFTKTSEGFSLPLKKNSKSIVCVNRNFDDTQDFGNAFCAALDEYSFDCMVKLAEFIPKEAVVGYDYVWTFQVKKWTDKNLDNIPESVSALVLLYDRDFKLLLKSSLKIRKNKKNPSAPNCLDLLVSEYAKSVFTDIVEVKPSSSDAAKAEKKAKSKENKKNKKKGADAPAEEVEASQSQEQ